MSQVALWIHTGLAQALGWTLAHFVWEGAVLALLLAAGLRLFQRATARWRYALASAILAAMPVAFAVTLAVMCARQPVPAALPRMPVLASPLLDPVAVPAAGFTLADILDRLAWLAPFWVVGVLYFYARGMAAWIAVERLRRRGVCAPPSVWQTRLDELAARLRIQRPVVLLESCFTDTPVLIGYLRLVVLLPLGCLTGLSAGQVECILLHELAHVRRYDYVVNLLQGLVEGLLFYHPAVWWVSRVVRAERENCCDDAVVELVGDARAYAATLARLEQRRSLAPQAAMAATGGNLIRRIRRLTADPRHTQTSVAPAVSAGLLLVLLAAGLAALPARLPVAGRVRAAMGVALEAAAPQTSTQSVQDREAALPVQYRKWLNEDAAFIIQDEERAAFLRLNSDAERENFIEQFWKRRDPTPGTPENEFKEEHYRRIAFANQHFASGIPGWTTDRGRIYITYGAPDSIATPDARTFVWTYRYIEGFGEGVVIEFVDSQGNGEFHMTMDPHQFRAGPPQADRPAKVPAPQQKLKISVTVAAAPPGAIGVGDVLSVGVLTAQVAAPSAVDQQKLIAIEQTISMKKAEVEALLRRFQPSFPDVLAARDQLKVLEERRDEIANAILQSQTAEIEREARSGAQLSAPDQRLDSRVTVRPDGKISIPSTGEIMAAGLTPSQLEASLDSRLGGRPGSQVRIEQPVSQDRRQVTVQVPLDASEHVHVFGEVTTLAGRVVQSFDKDISAQPAAAKVLPLRMVLPLRAGTYRLVVVVKDMATGRTQNSESQFTME
jgi:GWxTD domain-containing protein